MIRESKRCHYFVGDKRCKGPHICINHVITGTPSRILRVFLQGMVEQICWGLE